jgi:hypothetical protein
MEHDTRQWRQGRGLMRKQVKSRLSADEHATQSPTQLATRLRPVGDALTDRARSLKSGNTSIAAAACGFVGDVERRLAGGLE